MLLREAFKPTWSTVSPLKLLKRKKIAMQSPSASLRVSATFTLMGGVLVLVGYMLPLARVSYSTGKGPSWLIGNDNWLLALAALVVISTSAASLWRSKQSPRSAGLCFAVALAGLLTHLLWTQLTLFSGWGMNFYVSHSVHLAAGFWSQLAGSILMACSALLLMALSRGREKV